MIYSCCIQSTTTPKKGGLNGDPERVFNPVKNGLTAETLRTQRVFFDLFSFERKENK